MPFKNITIEDYDKHYNGDLVEFYSKMCNQTFDNVSKFYDKNRYLIQNMTPIRS